MKYVYFLICVFLFLGEQVQGQHLLLENQGSIDKGFPEEKFNGIVKSVKQKYYTIGKTRKADEIQKESKQPAYQINTDFSFSGKIIRTDGPGFITKSYAYDYFTSNLSQIDQTGETDDKYFRRIIDFKYDNREKLIEKIELNIPYDKTDAGVEYQFTEPYLRSKVLYEYNDDGKLTSIVIYETHDSFDAVYREEYTYGTDGKLFEKRGYNRGDELAVREDYDRGTPYRTIYFSRGKIYRKIFYNDQGKPTEDTRVKWDDTENMTYYEYDENGRVSEWVSYGSSGELKDTYTGIEDPKYSAKATYEYDSEGNCISWAFFDKKGVLLDRYFFQCEYDKNNNWIKKAVIDSQMGSDKFVIVERTIEYY